MRVPFIKLTDQYHSIKPAIDQAIAEVFEAGLFTNSVRVKRFEQSFAAYHNSPHCIAVNNGTAALHTALQSLKTGPGDEVILPSHTFISTALAVSYTGATPIFVDCDPKYFSLDMAQVEKSLSPKTKAIIAVHLYGQMAPMDELNTLSENNPLSIIEDCAQAHGSRQNGQLAGTLGKAGCFSFYPVKNLGAYGEGGAVITSDRTIQEKIRMLRMYGSREKYTYELLGNNYRMSELQGAILQVKLEKLEEWTARRIALAERYTDQLHGLAEITTPAVRPGNKHVFHLYVIRTRKRDELREYLEEKGIRTEIHYPVPCHLQPVYAHLGYKQGDFPVTEAISNEALSLPLCEQHTDEEIDYVCEQIKSFFQ